MKKMLVALLLFISLISSAYQVTVGWDASPDIFVNDYRVYWGTNNPIFTTNRWGNIIVTNMGGDIIVNGTICDISNLTYNTTYYLFVTARDAYWVESDPSNVISLNVDQTSLSPSMENPQYTKNQLTQLPQFSFSISEHAGSSYVIQATTNLLSNWENLSTNTSPFTFTDTNAYKYPMRFYRLKTIQ